MSIEAREAQPQHLTPGWQSSQNRENDQPHTFGEIEAIDNDRLSLSRLQRYAQRAHRLPEGILAEQQNISAITVTSEDAEEQLVEYVLATRGTPNVVGASERFNKAKKELEEIVSAPSAVRLIDMLFREKDFFEILDGFDDLQILYANINVLPTLSTRGLMQAIRQAKLPDLLSSDARRDLIFSRMIEDEILEPNAREILQANAAVMTCNLRTAQLEHLAQKSNLRGDEKKALYSASLLDLTEKNLSPTLVEGITLGKITSKELFDASTFDWLLTEEPENLEEIFQELAQNEPSKLEEKLRLAMELFVNTSKEAVRAALAPIILALAYLAKLRSRFPGVAISLPGNLPHLQLPEIPSPKIPFRISVPSLPNLEFGNPFAGSEGEGGADLDLGNPFGGVERLGNRVVWQIISGSAEYFRLRSSSTFVIQNGAWTEDTVTRSSHSSPSEVQITGEIKGSQNISGENFTYIPAPYSAAISGNMQRRSDGSFGYDPLLDHNFPRKVERVRYNSSGASIKEYYPFDTEASLMPIIQNPDDLPSDVKKFLKRLENDKLSKRQELEEIIAYVRDTFIYSLDPANTQIYQDALAQGDKAFFQTIYEYKKVKCDGAATAAVALLRLRGIPSRMAVGFRVEPHAKEILVKDAHAWVEATIDSYARYEDPTPTEMDEVTRQMQDESNFAKRMFDSLYERITNKRLSELMERNLSSAKSIMDTVEDQDTGRLPKRLYRPLPGLSRREITALRGKVLQDQHQLRLIKQRVEGEQSTTYDVVDLFDQRSVVPAQHLRAEIIEENFKDLARPIVVVLYKDIYSSSPFDEKFIRKYGLYDFWFKQGYDWSAAANRFFLNGLPNVADFLDTVAEQGSDGMSTQEYISVLTSGLKRAIIDRLMVDRKWIKDNITNRKLDPQKYMEDLAEQVFLYEMKLQPELVRQSPLPKLALSMIHARGTVNSLG